MLMVCYVALLLPVLGFVNIYFMEYSLVADHWQYAAMIVPCAVFAGVAATLGRRLSRWRPAGYVLCLGLLAILAALTFRQSRMYADMETLYRTIIEHNPDCWMAHDNLGSVLVRRGQVDEAIEYYRKALALKPDYAEAHCNLAAVLAEHGQLGEAIRHYAAALDFDPRCSRAANNLGVVLGKCGEIAASIDRFRTAVEADPGNVEADGNLGNAPGTFRTV